MLLNYPIILCLGEVTVDTSQSLHKAGIRIIDSGFLTIKEKSLATEPKSGWLLDATGNFFTLNFSKKRNERARPLSFLWRFTLNEYEISKSRKITVAEMKQRVCIIPDKNPEVPFASDFCQFLSQHPESSVVSKEMLLQWPL